MKLFIIVGVIFSSLIALSCADSNMPAYKVYGNQYAYNNNWGDPQNIITSEFGEGTEPSMTTSFNFDNKGLYGYPAIVRGWHYNFNPTSDQLLPVLVSKIKSIPLKFSYSQTGTNMAGDFAYDIFFREDAAKTNPQLEVMIWGDHNSYPIGNLAASNVVTAGGRNFDLWAGMNDAAGYYVYTFVPANSVGNTVLATTGNLDLDAKVFFDYLLQSRASEGHYNNNMFLDVIEAGFEVVCGKGSVNLNADINVVV